MKIFSVFLPHQSHSYGYAPSSGENLTSKIQFKSDATYDFRITKDIVEASWIAGFSQEKLENYEMDMKTELDYEWGLDCARDERLEEGLERGREEKALETARNFKASGIAAEIIAR